MITTIKRLFVISVVLTLAGCASSSRQPQPDAKPIPRATTPGTAAPAVVRPQPGAVPRPTPSVSLNPAAISLAKQARSQYAAQDFQGAIATAERGLRIERRAAELYLVLAQSYAHLGQAQKAQMFAQQGLRYAPRNSEVESGLIQVKNSAY